MVRRSLPAGLLALLALSVPLSAQARAPTSPDPGVLSQRLLDRAETRVSRLALEPGAVRSVHAHDDVVFLVFLVASGRFRMHMPQDTVELREGDVLYVERGVPHGFDNPGDVPAVAFEVFVKPEAGG